MASSFLTARFQTPSSSTFSPRTMPLSSPILFSRAPGVLSHPRFSAFTNSSKKGLFLFDLCFFCLFFPWINGLFVVSGVERHGFPAKMLRVSSPVWAGSEIFLFGVWGLWCMLGVCWNAYEHGLYVQRGLCFTRVRQMLCLWIISWSVFTSWLSMHCLLASFIISIMCWLNKL